MEANAGGSVGAAGRAYHHPAPAAITTTATSAGQSAERAERLAVIDRVRPDASLSTSSLRRRRSARRSFAV